MKCFLDRDFLWRFIPMLAFIIACQFDVTLQSPFIWIRLVIGIYVLVRAIDFALNEVVDFCFYLERMKR